MTGLLTIQRSRRGHQEESSKKEGGGGEEQQQQQLLERKWKPGSNAKEEPATASLIEDGEECHGEVSVLKREKE